MSIIYDALKKVEKSNQAEPKDPPVKRVKGNFSGILVYILVAVAGFYIANFLFSYFLSLKGKSAAKASVRAVTPKTEKAAPVPLPVSSSPSLPLAPQKPKPKPAAVSFAVSGVFFSDNEGYALINNKIIREGDTLEGGFKVMRISLDGVELKGEGEEIFKLPAVK